MILMAFLNIHLKTETAWKKGKSLNTQSSFVVSLATEEKTCDWLVMRKGFRTSD